MKIFGLSFGAVSEKGKPPPDPQNESGRRSLFPPEQYSSRNGVAYRMQNHFAFDLEFH